MKRNQLRIIGGIWRGRKIHFPDVDGLRPTPDRVRETVFNWLAPYIQGAHCLDLFSGSGALSFEALSRGAGNVIIVEKNKEAIMHLHENASHLKASNVEIIHEDCLSFLKNTVPKTAFDIVFVDPPYADKLLPTCFTLLDQKNWLKKNTFIYFEAETLIHDTELPSRWKTLKVKKAGRVYYHLTQMTI